MVIRVVAVLYPLAQGKTLVVAAPAATNFLFRCMGALAVTLTTAIGLHICVPVPTLTVGTSALWSG